jgi:4,5-dihydroxyphthalate decarboxylase
MSKLELYAAFGDYDRTGGLAAGRVSPGDIDLRTETLPPTEIFTRMCKVLEFGLSEMSMGSHCYLLGTGDSPFVGMTAVVWIVGILAEEYGLDVNSIDWVAAIDPRVPIRMPEGARVRNMEPGQTISSMLDSGEVDGALIHQVPECFRAGSPRVKRIFPDYGAAEIEYYRRTGIHPIMHCVVLRKDVYERDPWALRSV